jgi:phosphodiesterase/alkaline phosphatase D-like protein
MARRLFQKPSAKMQILGSLGKWLLLWLLGSTIAAAAPTVTTTAATSVTDLQATLKGTVNANGLGYWTCTFQYGKTTSYELGEFSPTGRYWVDGPTDGSTPIAISGNPTPTSISGITVYPLEPATLYHFRIKARSTSGDSYYGAGLTFTTLAAKTKPTISAVSSGAPVVLGYNAARVRSVIFSGSSATTIVVEYGLSASYGSQVSWPGTLALNTQQTISADIPGLIPSTLYYYRWKATNSQGTTTGGASTFTTPPMPTVTTTAATSITSDKATLRGNINTNGGQVASPYFEYGTTTSYGVIDSNISPSFVSGTNPVEVTTNLTGLLPNTTYHYRIFANQAGMPTKTYGSDMTFTTSPVGTVPVITGPFPVSEITTRSAVVRAASVTAGTSTATVSFQYGPTTSYGQETTSPFTVAAGTTVDNPTVTLTGLPPNTTYHFRCKATNSIGTSYGSDGVFTTASVPIVTTGAATAISDLYATLGGTVVAGGGPCYPRIHWGKTTTYGSVIFAEIDATASGPVAVRPSVGPLEPSTTYHFRLVAYDGQDTIYGQDQTFTTTAPSTPPWIDSPKVDYVHFNIYDHKRPFVSATTAILGASYGEGGAPATLAFEYGTTSQYGKEIISYDMAYINNLMPNTTYHFRGRVSNYLGTAYTEDATFTTLNLPVLLTRTAALASVNSAVLRGSLDPKLWNYYPEFEFGTTLDFGSAPESSLPYNIDAYPFGNPIYGPRNVSALASGLLPDTTYFFRLKCKTSTGGEWLYYHGPVQTFKTLATGAPAFGHAVRATKNQPLSIGDGSILASIADKEGVAVSIATSASASARGGAVSRGANSVTYTPAADFIGLDTFAMTVSDGLGGSHPGIVTAIVGDTSALGGGDSQLSIQPGGNVAMLFRGTPGASYDIQRSTDLKTWYTLQSAIAADSGLLPFTDTNPPQGAAYYRTKSQ